MNVRNQSWRLAKCSLLAVSALLLASCGYFQRVEPTPVQRGASQAQTASPALDPTIAEPLSRYGNPEFYDVLGTRYVPLKSARGYRERGIASWYGPDFHGEMTSTREAYDMYKMTGAHKVLPLPTWVEVTNLENGRKVKLRVNDRGPFKDNRIIDLSYAAALALEVVRPGTAFVEVRASDSPSATNDRASAMVVAGPRARMYLQVGAFGEQANAERLKLRLDGEFGNEVRIFAEPPEAPQFYKVQLGPIRDVAHADRVAATLLSIGINEHHFVTN